jgi:hypothetical protein
LIARTAEADGGIAMGNRTRAIALTNNVFAWVDGYGFLAGTVLQCKPGVTNANGPLGTNSTATMATTVNTNAVIFELLATIATSNEKHCNQRQHSL